MPEKPKAEPKEKEKGAAPSDPGTLSADQRQHRYYYDDACGYEEYIPDDEDPDDPRDEAAGP